MLGNVRYDAWINTLTGANTTRDKMTYGYFGAGNRLDDDTADVMLHEDDLASWLCEVMPEYAMRKGFRVSISPEEDTDDLDSLAASLKEEENEMQSAFSRLDASCKVVDGLVWANVFGAAAILPGVDDGARGEDLKEPLNEEKITSFTHLNVIDRRYLTPVSWYENPLEENFGKPKTYIITPFAMSASTNLTGLGELNGIYEIHESRLIMFGGVRTSIKRRQENNGWEDSLLQRVHTVLRQYGLSWDVLPHILQDAYQGVFKMGGLIDAIAADEEGYIFKRMQLMDMQRSNIRALALDAESEDFMRQTTNFTGISEPFELFERRLAVAARTPITLLFGRSPGGMNATGESDTENFVSQIESYQVQRIEKQLRRLTELLLKSKDGPTNGRVPENWEIEFPPPRTLTLKEQAEIRGMLATADATWIDAGVLDADEVALNRFAPEGFSIETKINLKSRVAPENPEDLEGPKDGLKENNAQNASGEPTGGGVEGEAPKEKPIPSEN